MKRKILFVFPMMLGTAAMAFGDENLGQIDVTSSRVASPVATASRPVTVIDRKAIEESHAENVVDLLKGRADIVVRDTSGIGAKSQVDLGGFGESASANSVVLVDGRRVNSPDLSGTDWTQIPLDQIERIEIVHGASSVLYGDGAVGGVINIITRIPESGGRIGLSGGSFGEFSGQARIGADSGDTRLEMNVSGLTSDGYRDNGFFDRLDGGARAEVDLPADISLRVSGNHHRDRAGLPGSLTRTQLDVNRRQTLTPRDYSKTVDSFVDGGLDWGAGAGLNLTLDGGFRRRESSANYSGFLIDSVIRSLSLRPKLVYETALSGLRLRLLGGADLYRHDAVLSSTTIRRKDDAWYGTVTLGGDNERWNISGGARSERIRDRFTKTSAQQNNKRATAWDAGASVAVTDELTLRLNVARSIRFPLLDEAFNFFTGTVNTSLRVQTGRHYSAGARYAFDRGWLDVNVSRADLTDEIFYNPLTFANENYGSKTRHDVVMVSARWNAHEWLKLGANYTWTRAVFAGGAFDGKRIPAIPRNRFGLEWGADWTAGLSSHVYLTYVGNSMLISDQSNARSPLPAYFVADAVVNYRWKNLEMFARVDNLTNRKYSTYGVFSSFSGDHFYPAPEVRFRAGASYRF